ncbi:MAG: 30S ribosomal protein S17, partial [Planctomycetota bacterium]
PKYGKFIRRKTVCHVHDEGNESKMGDTVEIIECPPKSKTKRWDLLRVVAKSELVDIQAMRAAQKLKQAEEAEAAESAAAASAAEPTPPAAEANDSTTTDSTPATE